MICLSRNLPALQVGTQQVADYDASWIDGIRYGILHKRESRCPLRIFALGNLFERMRIMLSKISGLAIAERHPPSPSPRHHLLSEEIDALKLAGKQLGAEIKAFLKRFQKQAITDERKLTLTLEP